MIGESSSTCMCTSSSFVERELCTKSSVSVLSVCFLLKLSDAGILSNEVVSSSRLGETGGGAPDSESSSKF